MLLGIGISSMAQQIPNAGFEDWINFKPTDWVTYSCPFCDPPFETYNVQQDLDACQGKYSTRFINNNQYSVCAKTKFASSVDLFCNIKQISILTTTNTFS